MFLRISRARSVRPQTSSVKGADPGAQENVIEPLTCCPVWTGPHDYAAFPPLPPPPEGQMKASPQTAREAPNRYKWRVMPG